MDFKLELILVRIKNNFGRSIYQGGNDDKKIIREKFDSKGILKFRETESEFLYIDLLKRKWWKDANNETKRKKNPSKGILDFWK